MTPRRASRGHHRGATAVEFALTAPILFMLLFASMEFMRASNLLHTADNAVYEAARRGIVPGATADDVTNAAQSVLDTLGVRDANIVVTPSTITTTTSEVAVLITIPMDSNNFVAPLFFSGRQISSSITMVREAFSQTNVGG